MTRARVALAAGAAGKLAIDAAGLVAFSAEHVQPASGGDTLTELDVGAAAGHVRCQGDVPRLAGLRHNLRFLFMLPGVEHLVLQTRGVQSLAECL